MAVDNFTKKTRRVRNALHSLHGGDSRQVSVRRRRLLRLINSELNNSNSDLKLGIFIHALGDSYAHIARNGYAYNDWYGHLFKGVDPDRVATNKQSYIRYVKVLYSILEGHGDSPSRNIDELLDIIRYDIPGNMPLHKETAIIRDLAIKEGFDDDKFIKLKGLYDPREGYSLANLIAVKDQR